MAKVLDPNQVQTPALDLIDEALVDLADGRTRRLSIFMPPQEGKSERASHWFPLWLLTQNPDLRIAIVSYSDEMARGWGRAIKADLEAFQGEDGSVDLGLRLRTDSKAAGRFQVEGYKGSVYCVGIAGSLTGKAVDVLIIDDPIKDLEQAQSAKYRDRAYRFWQGVAVPRLGNSSRTVLIQTRWHEADLAGQLLANEGRIEDGGKWKVISIPAQAEDDDPLGRKPGEFLVSTRGRAPADWIDRRQDVGEYVWAALFQQRPSPAEGGLFKRLWWRYWRRAPQTGVSPRLDCGGTVVDLQDCWRFATIDLAASTRTSADYTVVAAWAFTINGDLVLLDRNRARVGERDHFTLVRPLVQAWNLDTVFVEASQFATTLVKEATREGIPVSPLTAETDKFTRALPYSARVSAGRVWLPAGAEWAAEWIDEHASFPNATHDDQVDVGAYATRTTVVQWAPQAPGPNRVGDNIDPDAYGLGGGDYTQIVF